jgi:type III secretory pathway lipoprotein EscJ
MHDVSETKANKICVVLNEYKITAEKIKAGNNWNVQVQSKNVFPALRILDKSRFLRRDSIKNKSETKNFMVSKDERQKALERELAANLEETLEAIPEILEARIHFYFSPANDFDLLLESKQKSASILLVANGQVSADDDDLKNIVIQLISGAAGIEEKGINIVIAKDFIDNAGSISANNSSSVFIGDILKNKFAPIFSNKIFLISSLSFLGFLILGYLIRKTFKVKKISKVNEEPEADAIESKTITTEQETEEDAEAKRLAKLEKLKPFHYLNQGLF